MSHQRWPQCALCGAPAQDAVAGNRLLSCWNVYRLPAEGAPPVSWRCALHQRAQMRVAVAVSASEHGDLVFTLACGHQVHLVFRGRWAYTPALVTRALETGQIRLGRRHRCHLCADLERERKRRS